MNRCSNPYGQGYAFSILALLYPTLDFGTHFILIIFTRGHNSRRHGWPSAASLGGETSFYLEHVDLLANLQLLEGIPNQEKNDSDFDDWLNETFKNKRGRQASWISPT